MKCKFVAMTTAAVFAALLATGPSFGQGMVGPGAGGGGSPPPAAAPAPMAAPSAAPSRGGGGVAPSAQNRGPRGGSMAGAPMAGGGGHQAWRGDRHHDGYRRGGYGGGIYFGGGPYWGGPYAYDDDYYADAPAVAGDDVAYCMRRFRSYDPRSGTYLGNDGYRHACP